MALNLREANCYLRAYDLACEGTLKEKQDRLAQHIGCTYAPSEY
jgi:hypothetical protein